MAIRDRWYGEQQRVNSLVAQGERQALDEDRRDLLTDCSNKLDKAIDLIRDVYTELRGEGLDNARTLVEQSGNNLTQVITAIKSELRK